MKLAADQLPNDTKLLKELVIESFNEIAVLKEQLQSLRALIFGRKSEKSKSENSVEQFLMDFGEDSDITVAVEDAVKTPETIQIPAHARVKKGRKPLAEHLPREERVIDIPDADKVCECGCMKTVIGCEKSEQLEYIPAKHKVIGVLSANSLKRKAFDQYSASINFFGGICYDSNPERSP